MELRGSKKANSGESFSTSSFLIVPPTGRYRRDARCQSVIDEQTVRVVLPPIDLLVAAQWSGVPFKLKDYAASGESAERFLEDLKQFQPSTLVCQVTAPTLDGDLELSARAKELCPGLRIILVGGYWGPEGEQRILAERGFIDGIVRGEFEETLAEVLGGRSPGEIPGLTWRGPERPISNADRPPLEDLDRLPIPDRGRLDNALYRNPETGNSITTIMTSRGCPYGCIFCPARRVSGPKVRSRSADRVLEEIEDCVNNHGIRDFLFHADTFTWDREWVLELCAGIRDRGLNIRWAANSRVDTVDRERLEVMKETGCRVVGFGIESGSERMLEEMGKKTHLEVSRQAVGLCRKVGILSHTFYVIGLPGETRETLKETLEFALELDADFCDINIAYPLPGTPFYDTVEQEELWEAAAPGEGSYAQPAVRSRELSAEELAQARNRMLLKMYLRPRYICRTLRRAASEGLFRRYLGQAWRRLLQLA